MHHEDISAHRRGGHGDTPAVGGPRGPAFGAPAAGQHGGVLGALWECYHAVAQSVADGRPELDPRVMHRVAAALFSVARLAETGACHANAEPDTERRESLDSQDGVQSVGDSYEPTPSAAHTVTTYGAWGSKAGRTRGADGTGAEQKGEHPSPTEHATGRGPTKPREPRACGIYDMVTSEGSERDALRYEGKSEVGLRTETRQQSETGSMSSERNELLDHVNLMTDEEAYNFGAVEINDPEVGWMGRIDRSLPVCEYDRLCTCG